MRSLARSVKRTESDAKVVRLESSRQREEWKPLPPSVGLSHLHELLLYNCCFVEVACCQLKFLQKWMRNKKNMALNRPKFLWPDEDQTIQLWPA